MKVCLRHSRNDTLLKPVFEALNWATSGGSREYWNIANANYIHTSPFTPGCLCIYLYTPSLFHEVL